MYDIKTLSRLFNCYDHQSGLLNKLRCERSKHSKQNRKTNYNSNLDLYVSNHVSKLVISLLENNVKLADEFVGKLNTKEENDYGCYFKGYDYIKAYLFNKLTMEQIAKENNTSKQSVGYGIHLVLGGLDGK